MFTSNGASIFKKLKAQQLQQCTVGLLKKTILKTVIKTKKNEAPAFNIVVIYLAANLL